MYRLQESIMVQDSGLRSTIVKARLGTDIRKVVLHHNDDVTYNDLVLMMHRIFKIKPATNLALKYMDKDGDLITLADDHDLLLALQLEESPLSVIVLPDNFDADQIKMLDADLHKLQDLIQSVLETLRVTNTGSKKTDLYDVKDSELVSAQIEFKKEQAESHVSTDSGKDNSELHRESVATIQPSVHEQVNNSVTVPSSRGDITYPNILSHMIGLPPTAQQNDFKTPTPPPMQFGNDAGQEHRRSTPEKTTEMQDVHAHHNYGAPPASVPSETLSQTQIHHRQLQPTEAPPKAVPDFQQQQHNLMLQQQQQHQMMQLQQQHPGMQHSQFTQNQPPISQAMLQTNLQQVHSMSQPGYNVSPIGAAVPPTPQYGAPPNQHSTPSHQKPAPHAFGSTQGIQPPPTSFGEQAFSSHSYQQPAPTDSSAHRSNTPQSMPPSGMTRPTMPPSHAPPVGAPPTMFAAGVTGANPFVRDPRGAYYARPNFQPTSFPQ